MTRRAVVGTVACAWSILAVLGAASALGLRVNLTSSMPEGLWLKRPYGGVAQAGDAVAVCLPPTAQTRRYIGPGACENGLKPLLKTVGAVAGDIVAINPSGAAVNGVPLPRTALLPADSAGRPLSAYLVSACQVQPGQVFLFSSHDPAAYDSRYFGPVSTATVVAIGTPVLTLK